VPVSRRRDPGIRHARLKTLDGVADLGFSLMAWIVDPHKNALGIMQLK
jgi:hypothetical protein